jgi:spore protease
MLKRRTDLALEAKELWTESAEKETKLEGVRHGTACGRYQVNTVVIWTSRGSSLGTPWLLCDGKLDALARREEDAFGRAARAIAAELNGLLKLPEEATCLVVGLGNRAITPDAIGPGVADHTMVTRHLVEQAPEHFGSFRPVAALAAGVLGTTGVESGELVKAVAEKIRPGCIIAVDALASRSWDRCAPRTVANTGIVRLRRGGTTGPPHPGDLGRPSLPGSTHGSGTRGPGRRYSSGGRARGVDPEPWPGRATG